jgi:hypothetical protein
LSGNSYVQSSWALEESIQGRKLFAEIRYIIFGLPDSVGQNNFFPLILQVERSDSKLKRKPTTDANDFESVMKLTLALRFDAMNDSGSDDSGSESGNDDSDAWSE